MHRKRHQHPVGWVPPLGPSMEDEAQDFKEAEEEMKRKLFPLYGMYKLHKGRRK